MCEEVNLNEFELKILGSFISTFKLKKLALNSCSQAYRNYKKNKNCIKMLKS